ncbi:hypothetical protein Poli38472_004393 [Pythium oligandrum]|uniref:ER membrane protein complex subunit 10 n=1 Tax=Pythium oligandrum TaxID=41045 RepID=A0A8K1FFU1_PYTOL|nr:hypothetical protein Poli38472_004393 [Pythium oligandrum]|eukprot:TMW59324.1 hypothetical protein Poli38472_004393 [Pythium oligandrum]
MMLRHVWAALLLVCVVLASIAHADPREVESAEFKDEFGEEYDDRLARGNELDQRLEFELEHNIPSKGAAFSKRGRVEIVFSASSVKPKVTFLDLPVLAETDIRHLETLLRKNQHYTLRVRSDPENPDSAYVVTSIPMCMLAGTRMREDLTFHLSDSGKLLAVEYLTPYVSASTCAEYQKRELKNVKFAASASVLKPQNGPSPPKTISAKQKKAPKVVKNPVKDEEGEQPAEESQSFLRRYWYIILPLVVMSLFGSDPGPQGAPTGGAPAGGAGGGARRR